MKAPVMVAVLLAATAAAAPGPTGDGDPPSASRRLSGPAPVYRGPSRWQPVVGDTPAARARAMDARRSLRAYEGAPPVMPHSRNFARTKACLDCHADGIRLGNRYGPPVSHPHLASCEQCHVESRNLDVPPSGPAPGNGFDGLRPPVAGQRASTGAPPVMPHGTLMRTDCLSCHGPESQPGLRTDHPQRRHCVQCHAMAASLDQTSPFFDGRATLTIPPEPASPDDGPAGP